MTKRSVALVGVLVVMAMIGSSVIGAVSAWATSDAANGTYSVFLPLILNAIGAMAEVPQGAVMTFNLTSCPSGWTEVIDAQGRAIVGLPSGGSLNGEVGSGLSDMEDRMHTHNVNPANTGSTSAGGHSHMINPSDTGTTLGGNHEHVVEHPGRLSSLSGSHTHQVDPPPTNSLMFSSDSILYSVSPPLVSEYIVGQDQHNHTVNINPFDTSLSSEHRHLTNDTWNDTATSTAHSHSVNISQFSSGSIGNHSHSVDIPNTSSTTASTSDVMPYIQFLVCEKD